MMMEIFKNKRESTSFVAVKFIFSLFSQCSNKIVNKLKKVKNKRVIQLNQKQSNNANRNMIIIQVIFCNNVRFEIKSLRIMQLLKNIKRHENKATTHPKQPHYSSKTKFCQQILVNSIRYTKIKIRQLSFLNSNTISNKRGNKDQQLFI